MAEPLIKITYKQAISFAFFLVLYEFLTYIANDMIMPGMITVVNSFHAPQIYIATSLTVYILGGASLQLLLGPISDTYGRRRLMLLGSSLFFLFTIMIACANSMNQFLIARFFQGMGLCFIGVIGYATIQEIFAEMDAIRLIAIMANAAILAPLLGPLMGAVIIHYTSWRYIFVLIAAFALIALWGLWKFMPEPIGQTKRDGEVIPIAVFSFSAVLQNFKQLFTNPTFCFSVLATSIAMIPCMAWIALAPVILIAQAKLTVIQYGLWQLPVFGATILGNWVLHYLTYSFSIKKIITIGSAILLFGLTLTGLLPYFYGSNYLLLIPGTIIYFFSLTMLSAPLNRFCLFVTHVTKGTASAVISLATMIIGAIGIELASYAYYYQGHSNVNYGLYSIAAGVLYWFFIVLTFKVAKTDPPEIQP